MPRDSTGQYVAPIGTPGIPGGVITSEQFNNFVTDIGAEMTASATQGQIQGFSGGITTTGSGSAYALSLPTQPSDFTKLLRLTFRAHATSVSGTATITGTLSNASTTVSNVSSLAGLAVGQTITSALASSSFTGNVTNGSNQILAVSSTAGLFPGMTITGGVAGFPTGTTIQGISGTTVTVSANYTGSTGTGATIQATPGIQPNTTIAALASTTTNGVTTNTITLSLPAAGNTAVGATLTVAGTSPTLAVNTITARSIVAPDGSPLRAGEIQAGQFYSVVPDTQQNAYVIDPSPRLRLNPSDTKPGYLADKILNANGSALTVTTVNGIPVLQLPDRGLLVGDMLNTGLNPGANYLLRDGSVYQQSAYPGLYAAIGQKFQDINLLQAATIASGVQQLCAAYGAGVFVVGDNQFLMWSSPDGITWTQRSGTGAAPNAVIYAASKFVVGTANGGVFTSPDGLTYTSQGNVTGSTNRAITALAYGAGLFVAPFTNGGAANVITSPDGVTWTTRTAAVPTRGLTFGNGLFVAVGAGGAISTSPDGITWTARSSGTTATLNAVTFANGLFVAAGAAGDGTGAIITSPDGINWTARRSNLASPILSVVFGFGVFLANAASFVATSSDGLVWTPKAIPNANSTTFAGVAVGPSFFGLAAQASSLFWTGTPAANPATQFRVPNDNPTFGYIKAS